MLGNGEAIRTLARSKHAVWIGLIFVFSAALAREYDAEYIPHRPWIMLVPLAASLVSSFALWCVLWLASFSADRVRPAFWKNYRAFLGVFWLTAPLAWLYAIPVERFMEPVAAVQANYALLGIVATWRVVLMIRVAQVFTGRAAVPATLLVLGYGNAVLLLALLFSPWPVVEIMAGARRTEIQQAHLDILQGTFCLAFLAVPALFVLALFYMPFGLTGRRPKPRADAFPALRKSADTPARRRLWLLAAASVLLWLPLLPFTQPPLEGRQSEWDLANDYEERRQQWFREMGVRDHVLSDGEQLRVFGEDSSLLITADSRLRRRYAWSEYRLEVELARRDGDDAQDELYLEVSKPDEGIHHAVIREGRRDFESTEEALDWLRSRGPDLRWTRDGLAAAWSFTDGRLSVELWQVTVQNSTPSDLPGASDGWFLPKR